jgi:MerR family transcriptional regulator, light-induced transcriptional regulator
MPSEPADQREPVGVRIGELSRRVGVSAELLRAWERRYHLLEPVRSPKGYRLYTGADEHRVRSMREQLAQGLSAAEAARAARRLQGERPAADTGRAEGSDATSEHYRALEQALDAYDEVGAQQVFDTMFRRLTPVTVLRDVVMPYLRRLGERWEDGRVDVAQEHFASNVIRGRLGTLALGWGDGVGPRAVLACPVGELHDLPLMVFGIALNRSGWRITFLGTNTPVTDLENAVHQLRPDIVVLSATTPTSFLMAGEDLRRLGRLVPVVIAGAGATPDAVAATGAGALHGDPVTEARHLPVPSRSAVVTR